MNNGRRKEQLMIELITLEQSDREQFVKGLQDLYSEVECLAEDGLSGAIYTQLSDVEDETNGLFTFDRKVLKVRPDELFPIMKKLTRNDN